MKKTLYLILMAAFTAASCHKFIEETPKGRLIPTTVDDLGMMLDNEDAINVGIGNTLHYSNDIKGLESLVLGYVQYDINAMKFEDYHYGPAENDLDWNRLYHSISLTNFVIDNIDEAPEGVDKLHHRTAVKSTALFHRAYSYFLLVNEYAKHYDPATASNDPGVPLLLHLDVNTVPPRASVKAVYDQVLKDVTEASAILPETTAFSFQPTRRAAAAFLSLIYLYQGKFTESWKEAEKVTKQKELKDYNTVSRKVASDPRSGFNNLDGIDWKREEVIYFRQQWGMFRNFLFITTDLLQTYDAVNDLRFTLFLTDRLFANFSAWGVDRHSGLQLGDVYLTEAEAKVRDPQVPLDDVLTVLNRFIRTRYKTGYPPVSGTDRNLVRQRILEERRKEKAFTGMRLFDIKRLYVQDQIAEDLNSAWEGQPYTISAGGNKMVMPIPLNVVEKSKLQQNPR